MCQLRVRLLLADDGETLLDEVSDMTFAADHITVTRLFEPAETLYGFAVASINCLRNEVVLTQRRTAAAENGDA